MLQTIEFPLMLTFYGFLIGMGWTLGSIIVHTIISLWLGDDDD